MKVNVNSNLLHIITDKKFLIKMLKLLLLILYLTNLVNCKTPIYYTFNKNIPNFSQVASLDCFPAIKIISVDGNEKINPYSGVGFAYRGCDIRLLPGKHVIKALYRYSDDAKKSKIFTLQFNAKKNKDYSVTYLIDTSRVNLFIIMKNNQEAAKYKYSGNQKRIQGNYKGALADLNKAIELDPDVGGNYHDRGLIKYYLFDYRGSINDYSEAIAKGSKNMLVYHNRGNAKIALKDYKGGMEDINVALQFGYINGNPYHDRGVAKYRLKDNKGAIKDFDTAIRIDKGKYPGTFYHRGKAKMIVGNRQAGCYDMDKAFQLGDKNAGAVLFKYCKDGFGEITIRGEILWEEKVKKIKICRDSQIYILKTEADPFFNELMDAMWTKLAKQNVLAIVEGRFKQEKCDAPRTESCFNFTMSRYHNIKTGKCN